MCNELSEELHWWLPAQVSYRKNLQEKWMNLTRSHIHPKYSTKSGVCAKPVSSSVMAINLFLPAAAQRSPITVVFCCLRFCNWEKLPVLWPGARHVPFTTALVGQHSWRHCPKKNRAGQACRDASPEGLHSPQGLTAGFPAQDRPGLSWIERMAPMGTAPMGTAHPGASPAEAEGGKCLLGIA